MEYYLAIRKDEILPFVRWMDLDGIMLSEVSESEKAKNHMISLRWGIYGGYQREGRVGGSKGGQIYGDRR